MSHDVAIAELEKRIPQISRFIPEMRESLPLLLKDLQSIIRLDIPRDRKLLGIDLENLVTGISDVVAMRETGQDPASLTLAIIDLQRLATDMRARAARALNNAAEDIAINASVSARAARDDVEPEDLTREFREICAAPAPTLQNDGPGVMLDTNLRSGELKYGRVSGDHLYAERQFLRTSCAPRGAVILPAWAVARFEKCDTFLLYTDGKTQGDRMKAPSDGETAMEVIVEAGEGGATVYGPAILAAIPDAQGVLSEAVEAYEHVTAFQRRMAAQAPSQSLHAYWGLSVFIMLSLVGLGAIVSPTPGTLKMMIAAALVSSFGLCLFGIRKQDQAMERFDEMMAEERKKLPANAATGRAGKRVQEIALVSMENVPREVRKSDGLNFRPVRLIEAEPGASLPVMKALPALPAPSPAEIVSLFPKKKAAV